MNNRIARAATAAGGAGTLAIAGVLQAWYEGEGPTVRQSSGAVLSVPYKDPVGIWTVCRGVTGPEVIPSKRYTAAEGRALEARHLAIAEAHARRYITAYDRLNKWQQAALIDWFYNLGANPATLNSTLRAKLNAGCIEGGCDELSRWVKGRVKGELVTLNGLVDRRDTGEELCLRWGSK
ncbi:lysozyme [Variovorax beijingensis]|uniref:Lysozyme n=1 Tax=Variovorax beijingensis TaxID=2496117 RepID=A0ABX9ZXI9_9BURK|nr:lysozyme [Variovorax beijingensis]RSZ28802.1 lysozyme [Variovorax beijingensis]